MRPLLRLLLVALLMLPLPLAAAADDTAPVAGGTVHVAVAANFLAAAQALAQRFEAEQPHEVVLSSGSTGKLYAQIVRGAPYDILLAADAERPERLEQEGRTVSGSRFTYARGRLVLWSRDPELVDAEGAVLQGEEIARLAIPNPNTAPYGAAAVQTLQALELWERFELRTVRGESSAHALQFAATGAAQAAFVALAQVRQPDRPMGGSLWLVPAELHDPVDQQAVWLRRAEDNAAAKAFVTFLKSPEAHEVIEAYGYNLP